MLSCALGFGIGCEGKTDETDDSWEGYEGSGEIIVDGTAVNVETDKDTWAQYCTEYEAITIDLALSDGASIEVRKFDTDPLTLVNTWDIDVDDVSVRWLDNNASPTLLFFEQQGTLVIDAFGDEGEMVTGSLDVTGYVENLDTSETVDEEVSITGEFTVERRSDGCL